MTRQVAAVHGRQVKRFEGMQVAGVVPVIEMAAQPGQCGQCAQGGFEAVDGIPQAEPAEVPRGEHGQQVKSEVGGRTAVRDDGMRRFLKIVRRQMVVFRGHERREEPPGAASDQAQLQKILGARVFAGVRLRREAQAPGQQRGQPP